MLNSVLVYAAVMSFVGSEPQSASATVTQPLATSSLMENAKSNASKMVKQPELKEEAPAEPQYPESEEALSNGGIVYVKGVVMVDGSFAEPVVVKSTANAVLTKAAVEASVRTVFIPAEDAQGNAIPVPAIIPFEFQFSEKFPQPINFIEAKYEDSVRAEGIHGSVTIGGIVGDDGHLTNISVLTSSRSPELDQAAIESAQASVFKTEKDKSGEHKNAAFRHTYEFVSYKSSGPGIPLSRYGCGQFVNDQEWWRANWPEKDKGELYYMMYGAAVTMNRSTYASNPAKFKSFTVEFESQWNAAIEQCKSNPSAFFLDFFKIGGQ